MCMQNSCADSVSSKYGNAWTHLITSVYEKIWTKNALNRIMLFQKMYGGFLTEFVFTIIIQSDDRIFILTTSYTFNILTSYDDKWNVTSDVQLHGLKDVFSLLRHVSKSF